MRRLILAAGLLLLFHFAAYAQAENLVLLGRAQDAGGAAEACGLGGEDRVLVLWRAGAREKKAAQSALAGTAGVEFLDFPSMKAGHTDAGSLSRVWESGERMAQLASLVRRSEPESLTVYSGDEELHAYLLAMAGRCALCAADPLCRRKGLKGEESVYRTPLVRDGRTGSCYAPEYPDLASVCAEAFRETLPVKVPEVPGTDEEGFLPDGEYLLEDADTGVWVYVSDGLRIEVTRHETEKLRWYEADIRRRPGADMLKIIGTESGRNQKPETLARDGHAVLALNADYYRYRIAYRMQVGLIVRGGEVLYDHAKATTGTALPPLDTLLLGGDGLFSVHLAGELSGQEALAMGARDVLAFGPVLIRDGRIRMLRTKTRLKLEPRTAVGRIGDNHFLAVTVEGRTKRSRGISLDDLARLMAARGCADAMNLDGGHTSCMLFMGTRLNIIGNLAGDGTSAPRSTSELLAIGTYADREGEGQ